MRLLIKNFEQLSLRNVVVFYGQLAQWYAAPLLPFYCLNELLRARLGGSVS